MNKVFLLLLLSLCLGLMGMESCFPGDGTDVDDIGNDALGTPDHGPPLRYTDNNDGTFTDEVTKWRWEIKTDDGGIHDVDTPYQWTVSAGEANGGLFTVFLHALNNTCDGEGVTNCDEDQDCGAGEKCGFAGFGDWCIPNVKKLQSIVDYSMCDGCNGNLAASSVPGLTAADNYWTSTTAAFNPIFAWTVNFTNGEVTPQGKSPSIGGPRARAVRPCDEDGKKFGFLINKAEGQ